jgi:hypothetical protein
LFLELDNFISIAAMVPLRESMKNKKTTMPDANDSFLVELRMPDGHAVRSKTTRSHDQWLCERLRSVDRRIITPIGVPNEPGQLPYVIDPFNVVQGNGGQTTRDARR